MQRAIYPSECHINAVLTQPGGARQLEARCAALQTVVQRLKHQSELQEARNNPVEEQLGGEDAFVEIDSLQAAVRGRGRGRGKVRVRADSLQGTAEVTHP